MTTPASQPAEDTHPGSLPDRHQAVRDEIRVVQSVQAQNSLPMLMIGIVMALANFALIDFELVVTSGAIYMMVLQVLLLVPLSLMYFRLRTRPRPDRVSKKRIRRIRDYTSLQGVVFATIPILLLPHASDVDAALFLWVLFFAALGCAILLPTVPLAALGFAGPIAVSAVATALYVGLFSPWLLIVLCTSGCIVICWAIWDNWQRTVNEVRLSVETVRAEAERGRAMEEISEQLGKYMSPQLYQSVFSGAQKVEIASKRKKLTVFFSDIVNFTEITDQLESEELTALLNRYLTEMSDIAISHGATIDKFIGDAIVVYFGDPDSLGVKEDASQCVRMAIAMQARVFELRREWLDMGLERTFELRIGINTGYCRVGNFGSNDRMDYTIIGNEVNLAARLEAASDVGGILLANETNSQVKDWVETTETAPITVKGFQRPVRTFRVESDPGEPVHNLAVIAEDGEGFSLKLDVDNMDAPSREKAKDILGQALARLHHVNK